MCIFWSHNQAGKVPAEKEGVDAEKESISRFPTSNRI